jgi:hypothetical protein
MLLFRDIAVACWVMEIQNNRTKPHGHTNSTPQSLFVYLNEMTGWRTIMFRGIAGRQGAENSSVGTFFVQKCLVFSASILSRVLPRITYN